MNVFFVLVGVSFFGILAVFWLLKNEGKPSLRDLGVPLPAAEPALKKPSLFAGVFAKPRKVKKSSEENVMKEIVSPGVTDFSERPFGAGEETRGLVPVTQEVNLSADEEKKIEQEIDFTARIEEWQGKYERLDKLFNEKSAALEKSEESLKNELNNRREFNKVKDILEKELRETRDKARNVQGEFNAARTEAEGSKKKISQLEDKVTKMEKTLLGKDDEIVVLRKKLETLASIPPVAAAAPESPAASIVPEVAASSVEMLPQVLPVDLPDISPQNVAPETNGDEPKVPDAANPSSSPSSVIPQEGESGLSEKPVQSQANLPDAQDKPAPQEETDKNNDEQKAAP